VLNLMGCIHPDNVLPTSFSKGVAVMMNTSTFFSSEVNRASSLPQDTPAIPPPTTIYLMDAGHEQNEQSSSSCKSMTDLSWL
jgi:hypothetical protein